MSNFEIDPACVGVRRFGEQACQSPDTARSLGACEACGIRLENMAFSDPLTGLPNRYAAEHHFDLLVAKEEPTLIIHGDIVNFREVNKRIDHNTGDLMLGRIASRFQEVCDKTHDEALAARIGGDEFSVIMPVIDAGLRAPRSGLRTVYQMDSIQASQMYAAENMIGHLTEAVVTDPAIIRYNLRIGRELPLSLRFNYVIHDTKAKPDANLDELMEQADSKGIAASQNMTPELTEFAQWLKLVVQDRRRTNQ